jgi:CLASP N terminal
LHTKFGAPEWLDKIGELKDWKAKKEMLDELLKESDVPKIKPADFTNIAKVIKKFIGDSNAAVSNSAVKIC